MAWLLIVLISQIAFNFVLEIFLVRRLFSFLLSFSWNQCFSHCSKLWIDNKSQYIFIQFMFFWKFQDFWLTYLPCENFKTFGCLVNFKNLKISRLFVFLKISRLASSWARSMHNYIPLNNLVTSSSIFAVVFRNRLLIHVRYVEAHCLASMQTIQWCQCLHHFFWPVLPFCQEKVGYHIDSGKEPIITYT